MELDFYYYVGDSTAGDVRCLLRGGEVDFCVTVTITNHYTSSLFAEYLCIG